MLNVVQRGVKPFERVVKRSEVKKKSTIYICVCYIIMNNIPHVDTYPRDCNA